MKILKNQEVIFFPPQLKQLREERNKAFKESDLKKYFELSNKIKKFNPICWN